MPPPRSRALRLEALIIAAAVLFLAVVIGAAIKIDYDGAMERGVARADTEARLIAEHASLVFRLSNRAIERTLSAIGNTPLPQIADTPEKWSRFSYIAQDLAEDGSIWIIDRDGNLVFTSATFAPPPLSFADREYFQAHAEGDDYHIGRVQTGKLTGTPFFSVSRRIETAGTFAGVVLVTVRPNYFADFYASLDLGPKSSIAMLRNDGALLARAPAATEEARGRIAQSMPASARRAVSIGPSSVDQEERIAVLRRVPGQPVIVSAALSRETVLAPWRRRTLALVGFAVAATALLTLLFVVSIRAHRQEQAALAEAQRLSDQLTDALARERMMRSELAHRTKNNLALMIAMLNVESRRAEGHHNQAFEATAGRIRALALTQQLLDHPGAGGQLECSEYLRKIASVLIDAETTRRIELKLSLEPISLPAEKAQALGLIANELLTNTLKYAFKDRLTGTVGLSLHASDGRMLFVYSDDGSGFSGRSRKDSKGMRLIGALANTLGATYTISGTDGVHFELAFPWPAPDTEIAADADRAMAE